LNPSEQSKREEDFVICECKLCGHKAQKMYMVTFFDYEGLLKNMYDLPNGTYCIGCLNSIKSKKEDTGRFIGQTEMEKLGWVSDAVRELQKLERK